jgi:uncharacterized protein (TIGR03435 family)
MMLLCSKRLWLSAAICAAMLAQPGAPPAFEVASVKTTPPDGQTSFNFPLGPGDAYTPNGGYFNATGVTLSQYIGFAYKLVGYPVTYLASQYPAWVTTERFDIQARAQGNPGKDQMRMMMRALLAERFKLAMHEDQREIPVAALVLAKPGKLGPQIQAHPADQPCPKDAQPGRLAAGDPRFPLVCGGLLQMMPSAPGRLHYGGRDITMEFIAKVMSAGTSSGRPMVDRTGLTGTYDFNLEWTPDSNSPVKADGEPDPNGPTFEQALREQLGFKLESLKASMPVWVLDHVERPAGN